MTESVIKWGKNPSFTSVARQTDINGFISWSALGIDGLSVNNVWNVYVRYNSPIVIAYSTSGITLYNINNTPLVNTWIDIYVTYLK